MVGRLIIKYFPFWKSYSQRRRVKILSKKGKLREQKSTPQNLKSRLEILQYISTCTRFTWKCLMLILFTWKGSDFPMEKILRLLHIILWHKRRGKERNWSNKQLMLVYKGGNGSSNNSWESFITVYYPNNRSFVLLAQLPSKQPAIFGKIDLRLLLLAGGQATLTYWDKLRGGDESDVQPTCT